MNVTAIREEIEAKHQAAEREIKARYAGRDEQGRFVKGNTGGPGNPFARQVAQLRAALVNHVTPEHMQRIAVVLTDKALSGDVAAIKLLFQYVLGKPGPSVDPDRLDVDEWRKLRESGVPIQHVNYLMERCPAGSASEVVNRSWPDVVERNIHEACKAELDAAADEAEEEMEELLRAAESAKAASQAASDGRDGEAPSTNGSADLDETIAWLQRALDGTGVDPRPRVGESLFSRARPSPNGETRPGDPSPNGEKRRDDPSPNGEPRPAGVS